jgi:hypothetical protein
VQQGYFHGRRAPQGKAALLQGALTYRRPCGLMDKALVFGTKDCRFESCQGHFAQSAISQGGGNFSARDQVQAAVAQLAARRSHNPKVGSSILSCRIIDAWLTAVAAAAKQCRCGGTPRVS